MAIPKSETIWLDGKFVPWDEARIHVLSHVVHYGTSIFEGIRCYATRKGPAVFRLADHVERFYNSCKIYRMALPLDPQAFAGVIVETVRANGLGDCYIRPFAFRGYGEMGLNPLNNPVHLAVAAWRWGTYLGDEGLEKGISVAVSSWSRLAPNTVPTLAKAGGNYLNSQLVKLEALREGHAEGIVLDIYGHLSEGSGENVFIVRHGGLYTPESGDSILPGITRHSVIALARDFGITVHQQSLQRESLYIADEVFLTGTAAEITPVREVDGISVGTGQRGPVTERLQKAFFGIVSGEEPDRHGWLTYASRPIQ